MYVEAGDLIKYNIRGTLWADGTVVKINNHGRVQIKLQNGQLTWLESTQVKEKLRTRQPEEDEDGDSTTDSESGESDDRQDLAQARTHLGAPQQHPKKRDRSVSTAVNNSSEGNREVDIYLQLKQQWNIGSIIEVWSETQKKYVVAQIHEIEEMQDDVNETILVLRYLVENEDGSITTLRKKVFLSSDSIRPFVNRSAEEDLDELREERDILFQKVAELSEANDEFLLTIDHQSQTMEQLQLICEDLGSEKDDLNRQVEDLGDTINTQEQLIQDLQEQLEALLEHQAMSPDVDDDIE